MIKDKTPKLNMLPVTTSDQYGVYTNYKTPKQNHSQGKKDNSEGANTDYLEPRSRKEEAVKLANMSNLTDTHPDTQSQNQNDQNIPK